MRGVSSLLTCGTAELPLLLLLPGRGGCGKRGLLHISLPSVRGKGCHVSPRTVPQSPGSRGWRPAFLSLHRVEQIGLNATNTFLVYTEEDLGDLLKIKLTWEGKSQSWYNLWKELRSYLTQSRGSKQELHIRRIRVKSGETQRR